MKFNLLIGIMVVCAVFGTMVVADEIGGKNLFSQKVPSTFWSMYRDLSSTIATA